MILFFVVWTPRANFSSTKRERGLKYFSFLCAGMRNVKVSMILWAFFGAGSEWERFDVCGQVNHFWITDWIAQLWLELSGLDKCWMMTALQFRRGLMSPISLEIKWKLCKIYFPCFIRNFSFSPEISPQKENFLRGKMYSGNFHLKFPY